MTELADKTVFKDKKGIGMLVNTAITAAFGSISAMIGSKELININNKLQPKIVNKLNQLYGQRLLNIDSAELKNFRNKKETVEVVEENMELLAESFSEEFVSKMVSVFCGFVNSTLKTFTMNKINQAVSSVTKIQKNEGYFREKRKQHKIFHAERKCGVAYKSDTMTIENIIKEKEG